MIGVKKPNSGNSGAGITKITFREAFVGFIPDIADVQTLLNTYSLTVAANEGVVLLVSHYKNGVDGIVNITRYLFRNNGATVIYNSGNPIAANQLIFISELYPTIDDIVVIGGNPKTQYVDLGDISPDTLVEHLNALIAGGAVYNFTDATFSYYFRCIIDGVDLLYLFKGVDSVLGYVIYSTAAGNIFTEGDFLIFYDSDQAPILATEVALDTYEPTTGVIETGTSVQEAIEILDGNMQNAAIYLPEQGIIIADDFNRGALGPNYTNVGAGTFSIVGNQLQVSRAGALSNANYIVYNAYGNCNIESFTWQATIIPGTINGTSYGVGFTLQSNGSYLTIPGGRNSVQFGIALDNVNTGKISIYNNNSAVATSTSANGMAITSGDILKVMIKFIKDKFIVTLTNTTTGKANTLEYDVYNSSPYGLITPNAFRFGVIAMGGTHAVDDISVFSNDSVGVSYLLCGDSITKGLSCDNIINRWGELLNNNTTTSTQTNAGGGNCIEDLNVTEILALKPKKIIILIGINNFTIGDNQATVQGKYQTLVNALIAGGYVVGSSLYLGHLLPYTPHSANILLFNTWLSATYGANNCIDFYTPLANGTALRYSVDSLHPDLQGHRIMANLVINKFNLPSRIRKAGALFPVIYNNNGNLVIGDENSRSHTPVYQAEIINPSVGTSAMGAQVRVGNSINDNGGYFTSINGDSFGIFAAMTYAGAYIAKAVNVAGHLLSGGSHYFYGETGKTIGASFVPIVRMFINGITGNVGIGTATPHASALLDMSSTAKGFAPPAMTTTQRDAIPTPKEGLFIYNLTTHRPNFYDGTTWQAL